MDRRGAGAMDSKVGAGGGLGVHICTGPVAIKARGTGGHTGSTHSRCDAAPQRQPPIQGKILCSNAAAWWGFHFGDTVEEPKKREVVTIYEVDATGERNWARAVYNFRWTPQTDPFGVIHPIIDYPGVPVDHKTIKENHGVLKDIRVPVRPHFGTMGLAPAEADLVNSIPPSYTGKYR